MQCEHCRARLPEYVEGEGDIAWRSGMREHLRECPACRAEIADWETLRHAVTTAPLPGEGPQEPDWDALEARVLARTRDALPRPAPRAPRWLPASAAAAVGAVIIAVSALVEAPEPHGAVMRVAGEPLGAAETAALAADIALEWGDPLPWAADPEWDELDIDAAALAPLMLAQAWSDAGLAVDEDADWDDANADDWLSELDTVDDSALEEFFEQLKTSAAS